MTALAQHTRTPHKRASRRWVAVVCAALLVALAGCKSDKDATGSNVGRKKNDPLIAGPNLIPKQNVPVPDRATGPKGKPDPLVSPAGGSKTGYIDDPERFKGTFIPGEKSTPAALASRIKDGEELKIADAGVPLKPAGSALAGNVVEPPDDVEPLLKQLERFGVSREDRTLERDGGKYTFRASVQNSGTGSRRQYVGVSTIAYDAVKQVTDQIKNEK